MFGTTRSFLDYFSLKKLDDLPPLADLSDWESLCVQLDLPEVEGPGDSDADEIADFAAHDVRVLHVEGEASTHETSGPPDAPQPEEERVARKWPDSVG